MTIPLEILRTILLHNGVDGRTLAGVVRDCEAWEQAQEDALEKANSDAVQWRTVTATVEEVDPSYFYATDADVMNSPEY